MKPLTKTELKRSASARAKEFCRDAGFIWDWCESFNSFTKRKSDLLGLFDLIHFDGPAIVGVQVTQHNGSARVAKMTGTAQPGEDSSTADNRRRNLWAWLKAGNRAEVWDYRHRKSGGKVVAIERVVMPLEMSDLERGATVPGSLGEWLRDGDAREII